MLHLLAVNLMPDLLKSTLEQGLIFIGFFFFVIGLLSFSRVSCTVLGMAPHLRVLGSQREESEGPLLLIGVLVFCLLSNLLMVFPSLLEWVFSWQAPDVLVLHQSVIWILKIVVLMIVTAGLVSILSGASTFLRRTLASNGFWQEFWLAPPTRGFLFLTLAVLSVYLATSQYLASTNYDTALYHLPAVAHFLRFGPELGLANLHFSLGFYNLPLFGQAVLQSFSPSALILTPSLNSVFLIALASVVSARVKASMFLGHPLKNALLSRYFIFLGSFLLFGGLELDSLSSYNADFALTCATVSLIFMVVVDEQRAARGFPLTIVLMLPLIKLSGVLGMIFILLNPLLGFVLGGGDRNLSGKGRLVSINGLKAIFWCAAAKRRLLAFIVASYAVMLLSNAVLSGYLIFPEVSTGPLAAHAVPVEQVKMIKGSLVSYYARFNDNGTMSAIAHAQNWSLRQWFPHFLRTDRGILMIIWFLIASMLVALALCSFVLTRSNDSIDQLSLSIALLVVAGFAVFVLPPNPRFFPWIGAMLVYTYGLSLLRFPYVTAAGLLLAMNLLSIRLHRPLIKSVGDVNARRVLVSLADIHGWRPRRVMHSSKGDVLTVWRPPSDKCFATERPCTPYFWFLNK